eukprot:gene17327-17514_t
MIVGFMMFPMIPVFTMIPMIAIVAMMMGLALALEWWLMSRLVSDRCYPGFGVAQRACPSNPSHCRLYWLWDTCLVTGCHCALPTSVSGSSLQLTEATNKKNRG